MANALCYSGRREQLRDLGGRVVDLVVVGGGITGAGIALDAALRGLSVVLVEKADFANGASSKSSKLLHGGLRYLEHAELKLVFESLAQRNQLLEDVPHLAKKLSFFFPIFEGGFDKGWKIAAGLTLYDLLSAMSDWQDTEWHRRLSPDEAVAEEPHLRREGLRAAQRYMDGLTEDARLVIETVKTAVEAGAIALNYVEVTAFAKDDAGRITGIVARDALDGTAFELGARQVFNAAGPWVDALRRLDDPGCARRLRPTKGVHVLTEAFVREHAVVMRSTWPGEKTPRVLFVIPWGGRTLIGTTDTDHEGDPDDFSYLDQDVEASPEEVRYLLAAVNATFDVQLTEKDVLSAYAGWRPLIAPSEAVSESATSREYEVFAAPSGLLSIGGGKLTAFRTMAKAAVDAVVEALHRQSPHQRVSPSRIERMPLSGSEFGAFGYEGYQREALEDTMNLSHQLVATLVERYGSNWPALRNMIAVDDRLSERLEGLDPQLVYFAAEPVYAVDGEGAATACDFLMRRSRLFLLDSHQGLRAVRQVADLMAGRFAVLEGWDAATRASWVEAEVARYEAAVAENRDRRQPKTQPAG